MKGVDRGLSDSRRCGNSIAVIWFEGGDCLCSGRGLHTRFEGCNDRVLLA